MSRFLFIIIVHVIDRGFDNFLFFHVHNKYKKKKKTRRLMQLNGNQFIRKTIWFFLKIVASDIIFPMISNCMLQYKKRIAIYIRVYW